MFLGKLGRVNMKSLLREMLDRVPYLRNLRKQVRNQGKYPAGHYYSPIPNHEDVLAYIESAKWGDTELLDVTLNKESQFKLLQQYQEFYADLPFPEQKTENCRYYYDQSVFCYADAIFLYCFLRKNKPRRIVEVGSGLSSAVILDTVEKYSQQQTECTFIEPYPDRLMSILKPQDKEKSRIITTKVQDVPIDVFTELGPGDLLFIDSTHVLKCGSDVQFLIFNILPQLPKGVFVHFHDVFYPFEYPSKWLAQGIYWNEIYVLRAFLSYNSEWAIHFFNTFVAKEYKEFLENKMPLCLKNTGGSIYIQRVGKD